MRPRLDCAPHAPREAPHFPQHELKTRKNAIDVLAEIRFFFQYNTCAGWTTSLPTIASSTIISLRFGEDQSMPPPSILLPSHLLASSRTLAVVLPRLLVFKGYLNSLSTSSNLSRKLWNANTPSPGSWLPVVALIECMLS